MGDGSCGVRFAALRDRHPFSMGARVRLPTAIGVGPFSVGRALALGVGVGRLRGADLERPFWGIRVPTGSERSIVNMVDAYAERMSPGAYFSHITAARLWGIPLPFALERRSALDVAVRPGQVVPVGAGIRGIGFRSTKEMSFSSAASVSLLSRAPGATSGRCSARKTWWPLGISCSGAGVPLTCAWTEATSLMRWIAGRAGEGGRCSKGAFQRSPTARIHRPNR